MLSDSTERLNAMIKQRGVHQAMARSTISANKRIRVWISSLVLPRPVKVPASWSLNICAVASQISAALALTSAALGKKADIPTITAS